MLSALPIATLRPAFLEAIGRGPVVVSSPTGSGKSTEVPRWCEGSVLVVEPRRIACRTLASRVADLEGVELGGGVGYVVRDESVVSESTRIVFATPGMVLHNPALLARADLVILDEFHERGLDLDLLLALLLRPKARRSTSGLVIMSATLEGERVARHIDGTYLAAEGRAYPVDIRYLGGGDELPSPDDLPARLARALAASNSDSEGDVLVFLPGKSEIEACRRALLAVGISTIPLHGGLTLAEQRRAFDPSPSRKVILATNVAETSVTIPGVAVVIDSGLVRQTRYHDGRGSLSLSPIALDAASQRAGRAGRTGPGVCFRLWSRAASLAKSTPPEILRESLVPLVLSAAAWGERVEDLRLLDPATPYALEAARKDLDAWGAIAPDGTLTDGGRGMFALPLDAPLGRLLLEAERVGPACLDDAIDLVAALATGRPMFMPGPAPSFPEDDLRLAGCDATALVRAVRIGNPAVHHLSAFTLEEARRIRDRLRTSRNIARRTSSDPPFDGAALAQVAMLADRRSVYVVRRRGRDVAFSNGEGSELELARESAAQNVRDLEALVVFDVRTFGTGKATRSLVTCATPIALRTIARAGLGSDRLQAVRVESGRVVADVERVYAERVIATRTLVPTGEIARAAISALFTRGSIFKDALPLTRDRLAVRSLAAELARIGHAGGVASASPVPTLDAWVKDKLEALGVESGDDLSLLSSKDLTADDLPFESRSLIDRDYPRVVSVGDATYEADYDLARHQVILRMVRGSRKDPPPLSYLPHFSGLRICVDGPRGLAILRQRG